MNDVQIFKNAEFGEVRTLKIGNEPWFVGKDIAEVLGYKDTSDALKKHVDSEDKLSRRFANSGQNREMYIINESGLYSLILSSKLPAAKKFKRWVTSDVLPAIRKTGSCSAKSQQPTQNCVRWIFFVETSYTAKERRAAAMLMNALPKGSFFISRC